MDEDMKLPYLKKEATVTISLEAGMIGRLQELLVHLSGTREEVDTLKKKIENKEQITDKKEQGVIALSLLLHRISVIAKDTDQLTYRSMKDVISEAIHPRE